MSEKRYLHIVRVVVGQEILVGEEWYKYNGQEIRVNIIRGTYMYYINIYCDSVTFILINTFKFNLTYNTNKETIE